MVVDVIDVVVQFIFVCVVLLIIEKVSLLGVDGYFVLVNQVEYVGVLQGLYLYWVCYLLDCYGLLISDVLVMVVFDFSLLSLIMEVLGYLKVEVVYVVVVEGVLYFEDILVCWMWIFIEYLYWGVDCVWEVVEVVVFVFGWIVVDIDCEVVNYMVCVEVEVFFQVQFDDVLVDMLWVSVFEVCVEIFELVFLD